MMKHTAFAALLTILLSGLALGFLLVKEPARDVAVVVEKSHIKASQANFGDGRTEQMPERFVLLVDDGKRKINISCKRERWDAISVGDRVALAVVVDNRGIECFRLAED